MYGMTTNVLGIRSIINIFEDTHVYQELYGSRRKILKACASLPCKGVKNEKMAAL